jgi:type II secretory pathway component PulM
MAAGQQGSGLRARWDRQTDREKRMVMLLGVMAVLVGALLGGFIVNNEISSLESENEAMRQALRDIDTKRDGYQRAKAKTAQLEVRMGRGGAQLDGFLEQAAKEAGVQIDETNPRPPAPAGSQYVERSVDLRLRKVALEPLAKFLRHIETGPNLVVVTQLNVRTRDDKHEELEVEMTVSTYEHATDKGKKKEQKS